MDRRKAGQGQARGQLGFGPRLARVRLGLALERDELVPLAESSCTPTAHPQPAECGGGCLRVCGAACRLDQLGCERALMLSMCCAKACRTRTMSRNQPVVGSGLSEAILGQ